MKSRFLLALAFILVAIPAMQAQSHSATTSWVASTTPAVTYNVYRGTGACTTSPSMSIVAGSISPTTYADTTVLAGTSYCYYVKALKSGLESTASNSVTAIIPADAPLPPTSLTVVVN
jgi:fibronectin type 3 domain-containing protein